MATAVLATGIERLSSGAVVSDVSERPRVVRSASVVIIIDVRLVSPRDSSSGKHADFFIKQKHPAFQLSAFGGLMQTRTADLYNVNVAL